jgi:sigma-B regulation protein RsbU (phosphoserine phosphatase)
MPEIPGIEISAFSHPAMAVGGDYYEVIPLPGGRFLVMIADVSGKGLPASLYMAELHGMVRMAGSTRQRPKEMLTLLNNHLATSLERGSFITGTIALFDPDTGTVTIARAGHTPILRIRNLQAETFTPTGVPLGIRSRELFASSLEEITLEYLPGDRFVLYSDGISEAMNEDREEFGDERLLDVLVDCPPGLPTDTCARNVLRSVEEFRGEAEQNDDITMVIVEIASEEKSYAEGRTGMRKLEVES